MDKNHEITKAVVKYCSSGNIAAFGVESFDKVVVKENTLNSSPKITYEVKNIRVSPRKAYGERIENSTRVLLSTLVDNYENLRINDIVTVVLPDGSRVNTYVTEIGEENITVDLNHPLAGEYVQFSVILISIE